MNPDRIDIEDNPEQNEVVIRIDTTGTGRVLADGVIDHIRGMITANHPTPHDKWRDNE